MAVNNETPILKVRNLRVSFKTNTGTVKAVRGIDFSLYKGRTLAIVGESGSGKSVTSKAILGILANNKIVEDGRIIYDGKDLLTLPEHKFTKIRGVKISMIFQDPLSALNPIMKVGQQLTEAMYLENKALIRESKKQVNRVNYAISKVEGKDALAKVNYYAKNIRLEDQLFNLLKKDTYDYFYNTAVSETKTFVEALKVALKAVSDYKQAYLPENANECNASEAIKALNSIKKPLKDCKDFFKSSSDDIIDVHAVLMKNYLQSMIKSDKLNEDLKLLLEKNNVTSVFDLPAGIRAKQREIITPKETYYEFITGITNRLIDHLNELLKKYEEVVEAEVDALIKDYAKLAILSNNSFGLSDKFYQRLDDLLKAKLVDDYDALNQLVNGSRDEKAIEEALKKDYALTFEGIYIEQSMSYVESLRKLLEAISNYRKANLSKDASNFNVQTAMKDFQEVKQAVNDAFYPLVEIQDSTIANYPNLVKKYVDIMNNIVSHEKHIESLYVKYNVDNFAALPESVRLNEIEPTKDVNGYYSKLVDLTKSLELYINEQIEKYSKKDNAFVKALLNKYARLSVSNHKALTKSEAKFRAIELMREVGIPEPEKRFYQYPFEFSGGMRQRIVIAIALSGNPEILICDEPTTALDVTIQAQILELIQKLKVQKNLSIIFITHDLGVVANMADDIAVMYAGKIVEYGSVYDIFYDPRHPYTWALLSSMPDLDTQGKLEAIPGTPPNMLLPPRGDAFAARNNYAVALDYKQEPPFFKISDTHSAKTWLAHKDAIDVVPPKTVINRIKKSLKANPDNTPSYTLKKNSVLEIIKGGKK